PPALATAGNPHPAGDRPLTSTLVAPAGQPQLRRLPAGLPAMVQPNPLSDTAAVDVLLSAPIDGGARPDELAGLDALIRSGPAKDLGALGSEAALAARRGARAPEAPSEDPATRLQQLIAAQMDAHAGKAPAPVAVIVSGKVEPELVFAILEQQFGRVTPAKLPAAPAGRAGKRKLVRAMISKPLAQGGLGYV